MVRLMEGEARASYLARVEPEQAERLAAVNAAGLKALRTHLSSGEAVAFLGGGVRTPV